MTNNLEEHAAPPSDTEVNSAHPKKTLTSSSKLLIVTLILSLLILASFVYFAWQSNRVERINQINKEQINQNIGHLQQQQKILQDQLNQTLAQSTDQWQKIQQTLHSSLQQRAPQETDWILLRAKYYLELAQINAHWGQDQAVTRALLEQADELLQSVPEQGLFAVRQALAKEISQLQGLKKPDVIGLLSRLDAAQHQLNEIPIGLTFKDTEKDKPKTTTSSWREKLESSKQALSKLVVVRYQDADIRPLVSPQYQALLRESIFLNLQEAQWAVLQQNKAVYQLVLEQALANLQRNFNTSEAATEALIKQLEQLKQEPLENEKLRLDESLSLLKEWMTSQNRNSKAGEPIS